MPIAKHKPLAEPTVQPSLPKIQSEEYKSIVYDDKNVPLHSLIAYVEGAPWSVDYFGQVVSQHNDLREIDPGQPNVYQQYQKVVGLELRVGTPLTSSYDNETGITTVSGSAIIYPFIVPNVSDYFVTDAGNTRKGLFRITSVERKTFNRDSAFAVDYELVGYIDVVTELYNDLVSKVIRTYFFSKDRLIEGHQPMVKEEEYQRVSNLKAWYKDIVTYYFKTFFNRKFMTLVLPGQDVAIYDSFLVNYILKIVDSFDAYEIKSVKQIPTDNDPYMNQPQFWDLMMNKDYNSLSSCNQTMALVNKKLFNTNTFLQGIAFSNIDLVIYPDNPDTSLLVRSPENIKTPSMIEIETTAQSGVASLIDRQYVGATKTYELYHDVLSDPYYVFSQAFYQNLDGQSVLEVLTKDYLKGQTIDLKMLEAVMSKFKTFGRLEQFYYGPIILTLIKEADRASYT